MSNIGGIIKSIQNIMWQDTGLNGDAQRIEQLGWMLFLKIFSDKDKELELLDSKYKSPIPEKFHWVKEKGNWAGDDEGMTGDKLLEFVDRQLFPALRNIDLSTGNQRAVIVREVFEGNNNYMKSGINIRKVLNKLNEIDFNIAKDRHAFGELYETILKELQSAGKSGEFYTPRAITQFITDIIDPQLGEKILDPACGTGGYLTCAIEHLKKQAKNVKDRKSIEQNITGWEYKPLPYLLATTNLILHDIEVPNIKFGDALDQPLSNFTEKHRVNVILANPPFGGIVANNNETNFPQTFRTKESADLFLILMIHLLKQGGRAGIVLPDSSLTGEGIKQRVRQKLLEECNLHTIIRLPNSVFQPYAKVPTNLLFFEKGKPTEEIWYYEHRMPENYKAYSKTRPIQTKEFEAIKKWWTNRAESEVSWKISMEEIAKRNFDLDVKNPYLASISRSSPQIILAELNHTKQKKLNIIERFLKEISSLNYQEDLSFITEHFETLLEADKFNTEIKTLVLAFAMQGKLVKQNVDSESAKDLLEIVKKEKDKLINEGKLKKQKNLAPIKPEETPFTIPQNWEWCRLGEISQHNSGKTLDSGRNKGKLREYITTSNLYWGYFELEKLKQILIEDNELDRCSVSKGDLLICEGGEAGRAAIWNFDYDICFQNHIHRLRPYGKINSNFIYWYFLFLHLSGDINKYRKGMGISNLSGKALSSIIFPLPPLKEQSRIVNKIEQLMQLCDELQQILKQKKNENEKLLFSALRSAAQPSREFKKDKKPKTNKIPVLQDQEEKHFLKRKILATYIINQSLSDSKFGDVKFEKLLHLSDYFALKRNLGQNYYQQAAGPYDNSFTRAYFQQIESSKWFKRTRNGNQFVFSAAQNHSKSTNTYDYFSSEELKRVDAIISYFKKCDYEQPEIISTLYAVWNNRIIKQEPITDELLKEDFLKWDTQKMKYKDRLDSALQWMKKQNVIPDGWGKVIEKAKKKKK